MNASRKKISSDLAGTPHAGSNWCCWEGAGSQPSTLVAPSDGKPPRRPRRACRALSRAPTGDPPPRSPLPLPPRSGTRGQRKCRGRGGRRSFRYRSGVVSPNPSAAALLDPGAPQVDIRPGSRPLSTSCRRQERDRETRARAALLTTLPSVPQPTAGKSHQTSLTSGPHSQLKQCDPTCSVTWPRACRVTSTRERPAGKPAAKQFSEEQLTNRPDEPQPIVTRQRKELANVETTTKRAWQRFDQAPP